MLNIKKTYLTLKKILIFKKDYCKYNIYKTFVLYIDFI